MTRPPLLRLWLLGGALCAALLPIPFLGDLRPRAGILLCLWLAAHAAYLLAARGAMRGGARRPAALGLVLGIGLLARIIVIPAAPTLSEDVYRYLWDGRLVVSGVNPFAHAPTDPALAPFQDALLRRMNHPDLPTIYPPTAQVLFATAAAVHPDPLPWKLLLLGLEGLTLVALASLLRRRGLPAERLLLYYWNPLVIVESFGSGHLDLAIGVFLVAALALEEAGRRSLAGALFGLSVGVKYVSGILAPYWIRRRSFRLLFVSALVLAVLFAPFAGAGASLWTSLSVYTRRWEYNGFLYPVLIRAGLTGESARLLLGVALAAAVLAVTARARSASGAALASLMALALLAPTLYPWYLVPIAALLPLHPDAGLLVLTGLVPLSYATLPEYAATGVWHLPGWVPWVEYGGLAAVWIGAAALRRFKGGSAPGRGVNDG